MPLAPLCSAGIPTTSGFIIRGHEGRLGYAAMAESQDRRAGGLTMFVGAVAPTSRLFWAFSLPRFCQDRGSDPQLQRGWLLESTRWSR